MAKFCSNCGSPLNPGDRFCANCGGIVPEAEAAPAAEPEAPAVEEPAAEPAVEPAPEVEEPAVEAAPEVEAAPAVEEPVVEPVAEPEPVVEPEPAPEPVPVAEPAPAVEPEPVKAAGVSASEPIETFEEPVPEPAPIPVPPPTPAPAQVYQPAPAPAPQPTYQPAPQPVYQPAPQPTYQPAPAAAAAAPGMKPPVSGMCIAGFITALLGLFPLNWIFSIVGIHACKKHGKRLKGLGIFGLVWSIITTLLVVGIIGCGIIAFNNFSSDFDVDEFEDTIQEIMEEYEDYDY